MVCSCTCASAITSVPDDRENLKAEDLNIRPEIKAIKEEIIANRRYLHQYGLWKFLLS